MKINPANTSHVNVKLFSAATANPLGAKINSIAAFK
jgi:hypothetical protein